MKRFSHYFFPILILVPAFIFVGRLVFQQRTPYLQDSKNGRQVLYSLNREQLVGQTIFLEKKNVTQIEFYPQVSSRIFLNETLTVHIRASINQNQDISVVQIPFSSFAIWKKVSIPLPVVLQNDRAVYFLFETKAYEGVISFWGKPSPDHGGGLYINGFPEGADLAYTLYTQPSWSQYAPYLRSIFSRVWLLAVLTIFTAGLGGIVLSILHPPIRQSFLEVFIFALITGVVSVVLVSNLLSMSGLKIKIGPLLSIFTILLLISIILNRSWIISQGTRINHLFHSTLFSTLADQNRQRTARTGEIAVIPIYIVALLIGAFQISSLTVPSGPDAWFHYKLIKDIGDISQIVSDQNYPTGFHAFANLVHLFHPIPYSDLLLLVGKWASMLPALSLLLIGNTYLKNISSKLFVFILALFLIPLPNYLFTWGRYPFLFGLSILPAAVVMSFKTISDRKSVPLAIILVLGLALCHYGSIVIWAGLLIVFTLKEFFWQDGRIPPWFVLKTSLRRLLLVLLPLTILVLVKIAIFVRVSEWTDVINQSRLVASSEDAFHYIRLSFENGGLLSWLIVLVVLILKWYIAKKACRDIVLWLGIMLFFYLVQVSIIRAVVVNLSNTVIYFSMITPILGGFLFESPESVFFPLQSQGNFQIFLSRIIRSVYIMLFFIFALFSAYVSLNTINPLSPHFTSYDQQMIDWINKKLPPNENVLVLDKKGDDDFPTNNAGDWLQELTRLNVFHFEYDEEGGFAKLKDILKKNHIRYIYDNRGITDQPSLLSSDCFIYTGEISIHSDVCIEKLGLGPIN